MNTIETGCGGACTCGSAETKAAAPAPASAPTIDVAAPASTINGVAVHPPGAAPDAEALRELAWGELLRQRAVVLGYLPPMRALLAPELDDAARQAIDAMLDAEVPEQEPTDDECRRHYEASAAQFTVGQALKMRHILFAVTPGVDVQKLIRRAEDALLELAARDVSPGRFAQLAADLSNCPTGASGGDLGWVEPHDLSPELARALFFKPETGMAKGLQPRLIHSRFGLHIVDISEQRAGRLPAFDEVRSRIASQLMLRSRATALGQYMRLLAGAADVVGIELATEASPLVQ